MSQMGTAAFTEISNQTPPSRDALEATQRSPVSRMRSRETLTRCELENTLGGSRLCGRHAECVRAAGWKDRREYGSAEGGAHAGPTGRRDRSRNRPRTGRARERARDVRVRRADGDAARIPGRRRIESPARPDDRPARCGRSGGRAASVRSHPRARGRSGRPRSDGESGFRSQREHRTLAQHGEKPAAPSPRSSSRPIRHTALGSTNFEQRIPKAIPLYEDAKARGRRPRCY